MQDPPSCPSFDAYSSPHLVETADRVRQEEEQSTVQSNHYNYGNDMDNDDDFEFVLVRPDADHDFLNRNGEFYPVFPVFNRDLLMDDSIQDQQQSEDFHADMASPIRFSLEKLFIDDRDPPSSSSSSDADELERVPPGTYCVWTPKVSSSPSPGRCKKSNSTGSSSKPRWRLRDLLRRSSSDGKKTLVFLDPNSSNKLGKKKDEEKGETGKSTAAVKSKAAAKEKVSAHEMFYVKRKAMKEGDKKKSYLPYRQDLVGFFANVNGLGKTFPPF